MGYVDADLDLRIQEELIEGNHCLHIQVRSPCTRFGTAWNSILSGVSIFPTYPPLLFFPQTMAPLGWPIGVAGLEV